MNFNVYFDDETARRLTALAKRRRKTRNAVIREAVGDWLNRAGRPAWPASVLAHVGDQGLVPFEEHRMELATPTPDPFATG